jgi:hypothetical protein
MQGSSRITPPWELVYDLGQDRVERAVVPGGWVYRNWLAVGSDVSVHQINLVFVPTAPDPAPINLVPPLITGVGRVGQTLTCDTGEWEGTITSYAYQWQSDAVNVGSNANTYVPVVGDRNNTVVCAVTATNVTGSNTVTSSNSIDVQDEA